MKNENQCRSNKSFAWHEWVKGKLRELRSTTRQRKSPRSTRSPRPSDALARPSKTRIRGAAINTILSRVRHGCASFERRQRSKRQTSSWRVSRADVSSLAPPLFLSLHFPLSLGGPFFFHSVSSSRTHTSNFFFSPFPFFSFPAGLCNPRTSERDICVAECR